MRIAFACALLCVCAATAATTEPADRQRLRRQAADPATFEAAVAEGLKSADPVVRRWSLCQLWKKDPARAAAAGRAMAGDSDPGVRAFLVSIGALKRKTDFPFYRENVAATENPSDDHDYLPVGSVLIPTEGWRLKFDPKDEGHKAKVPWFAPEADDSDWKVANVKAHWEMQGFPDYDGVAWYRVRFAAPEKPADGKVFELCFGAVDEDAWVWLNGKYVGQRVKGEVAWNSPFRFDIGQEIAWGAENVLAVRVFDSRFGGGIWKPVRIEVLK